MSAKTIFDKKNVLVLGGAGFIGSFLCERLLKDSKVICVDNFISGSESNIDHLLRHKDFVFIKADINQLTDLSKFKELEQFKIKFQGVQEIYNLACPMSPREFMDKRVHTLMSNSVGLINTLNLAVKYQAKYLLTSSSVIYGPRQRDDYEFKEDYQGVVNHLTPRGCYDEGKRFAETAVETYRDFYNLEAKIARIFRTYGPRMPIGHGHMTSDFVISALNNDPLYIYGDDEFTSTFIFVTDVVDACIKLMDSAVTTPVNIGDNKLVKMTDFAQKIIDLCGSKSSIEYKDKLMFMTALGIPDLTTARDELGWFPIVRLEDGLRRTIEYTKAHKELLSLKPPVIEE